MDLVEVTDVDWSFDSNNIIFPDQDTLEFFTTDDPLADFKAKKLPVPKIWLDYFKAQDDTQCRRQFGIIRLTPWKEVDYFPMDCNAWYCPFCSKKKQSMLYRRLKNGEISKWRIKTHVVLTVKDKQTNEDIDRCYNDLITYLRRGVYARVLYDEFWIDSNGKEHNKVKLVDKREAVETDRLIEREHIQYVWVKEFQYERFLISGEWFRHLHIIFDQAINIYDIIPIWNHVSGTDFNYVYARLVRAWDSGNYLLKYLTKMMFQHLFLKQERRYGASAGVLQKLEKKPSEDIWYFDRLEVIRDLYDMYQLNKDKFLAHFDDILAMIKLGINYITANATKNHTILEYF
jgi:hypothetical protein